MRDPRRSPAFRGKESRKTFLVITLGALCLAAAFLAVAILLAACSGSVTSVIGREGGARISVQAELPAPLAARLRRFSGAGGGAPTAVFFDAGTIRKSIAAQPALSLIDLEQSSGDSFHLELATRSLEEFAASPGLAGSGLIAFTRGGDWAELHLRIERGSAKALSLLLPGIDPRLLDALSPPALEEDPVTEAEYRTMLKSLLGSATMPALEAASISLSFTAPGPVISSGGGSLSGSTLTARIPVVQALVLERPIELWLRWRQKN